MGDGQPKRGSMGHRFHPTSREVMKYLVGFAIDEPLPRQDQVMKVVDVYAEKEPWEIVEGSDSNYFITRLKKEKEHHQRCKRRVGDDGTWRSQDAVKQVFDDKGRLMGYIHHLKYTNKSPIVKELYGEWLMTEYSLYDGYVTNINKKIKYKDFAICKIKQKKKKSEEKDENMISDVEFDDFIKSLVQKEDHINNNAEEEKNNEDEVLAILLGCNDDEDQYCVNLQENIGTSNINVEEDQHLRDVINNINLDDIDFV